MPQMCVSSCTALPGTLRTSHPSDAYRCSLPSQLPVTATSSTESNSGPIVAGVVVGLAIVVAVGLLLVMRYRSRKRLVHDMQSTKTTMSPLPSKLPGHSPARPYYEDQFVFDPMNAVDNPIYGTGSNELHPEVTTSFLGGPHSRPASYQPVSPIQSESYLQLGGDLETSRL